MRLVRRPRPLPPSVLTPRRLRIRGLWPVPPGSRRGTDRTPVSAMHLCGVPGHRVRGTGLDGARSRRRAAAGRHHSTTRKGALALAVGAVAHEREKAAAAPDRPSRKSGWRIRSPVGAPRCANTEGLQIAAGWHLMRFGFDIRARRGPGAVHRQREQRGTVEGVVVDAARRAPVATHGARRHHGNPFGRHLTFTNDIEVRITVPHEADRTPRLERLRCTVKPFDASNPSYTGDPHARGVAEDRARPGRHGHMKPEWSLLERWPATVSGPDHDPRAGRQYPAVADWGLSPSA